MTLRRVEVPPDIPTESSVLEGIRVLVAQRITDEFAESVSFESWREDTLDAMVWALRGVVLGERLAEKEVTVVTEGIAVFVFPTSPWQFFKQRHATSWWMRWLVRRRPVRLDHSRQKVQRAKRVVLEQFATFPMSPLRTPEKYRGSEVVRYDRVTVSDR